MYYMSDVPVAMSWQLPDYSIFNAFVCFLVPNYVFSTISVFIINLLLTTCILQYFQTDKLQMQIFKSTSS